MRNTTQLIVFPQYYNSLNPFVADTQQFIVDGINFNTISTGNTMELGNPLFSKFLKYGITEPVDSNTLP